MWNMIDTGKGEEIHIQLHVVCLFLPFVCPANGVM